MDRSKGGNGAPGKEPGPYVPAIQADREEAARLGQKYAGWTPRQVEVTLAGEGDEYPFVQAFARHRLQLSTPPGSDPGIPVYKLEDGTDEFVKKNK